jgi:hypothetical protein
MADSSEPWLCRLQSALGRVESCPRDACPFWDPAEGLGGGCAVADLDVAANPEVAELLLGIRGQLEAVQTFDEERQTRDELYRLLSTGDADGG